MCVCMCALDHQEASFQVLDLTQDTKVNYLGSYYDNRTYLFAVLIAMPVLATVSSYETFVLHISAYCIDGRIFEIGYYLVRI